jgi:hypothetical protein
MRSQLSKDDLAALGEQIAEQAVHLDAAMHRLLADLRRFDQAGGWHTQGFSSCAHWLSWRVGWDPATARERVRVAKALVTLPKVEAALAAGTLSYSKARAITRVATPAIEPALLKYAEVCTASQLETICRKYQSVERRTRNQGRPHPEDRWVIAPSTASGMVCVKAMLCPDEAALLMQVIAQAARQCTQAAESPSADAPAETPAKPPRFDRADGLMAVVQAYARGTSPDRSPIELIVTAPAETLRKADVAAEPEVDADPRGTSIPVTVVAGTDTYLSPETTRRLACDCGLVEATVDPAGHPLSVGRKTRTIPAAIKRALLLRDCTCRFPACDHRLFLDGHHLCHWADGGETKIDNLTLLCSLHHSYVHEHGYQIIRSETGTLRFLDPRGNPVPAVPRRPIPQALGWPAIRAANSDQELSAQTGRCRWRGDRVVHRAAVNALFKLPPPEASPSQHQPLHPHPRDEDTADPDYDFVAAGRRTDDLLRWALAEFHATGIDPLTEGPPPRWVPPS